MRNGIRLRLSGYVVTSGYWHQYIGTPIPVGGSFTTRDQVDHRSSRLAELKAALTECTEVVFRLIGHGNGNGHPASPFGLRRDKRE